VRILDVIGKTTPFFEKHGIESPRLTIELLLAHLLKKKRLDLYMEFERELDESTLEKLREMVKRRTAGEPLQYITGETEFCGLKFMVDKRVLIPRPETELLVDVVLERLRAEGGGRKGEATDYQSPITNHRSPIIILDVGTGSGCIAIALARKLLAPGGEVRVRIYATDESAEALEVARANAKMHGVENNVGFFQGDMLEALSSSLRADAIVSNPPYIAQGELAKLPKEVRDFEPVRALAAGEDGLKAIRRLVMTAKRFMSSSGFVALEMGAGQRVVVEELFGAHGYVVANVVKDLQGHERVIVAVPKK
jgi:release factor glutamine methyltransferase